MYICSARRCSESFTHSEETGFCIFFEVTGYFELTQHVDPTSSLFILLFHSSRLGGTVICPTSSAPDSLTDSYVRVCVCGAGGQEAFLPRCVWTGQCASVCLMSPAAAAPHHTRYRQHTVLTMYTSFFPITDNLVRCLLWLYGCNCFNCRLLSLSRPH